MYTEKRVREITHPCLTPCSRGNSADISSSILTTALDPLYISGVNLSIFPPIPFSVLITYTQCKMRSKHLGDTPGYATLLSPTEFDQFDLEVKLFDLGLTS
eukprot:Rmarinus@m.15224